jgi:hypothetical protein
MNERTLPSRLFLLLGILAIPGAAQADMHVRIPLPPPILLPVPPPVVILPETDVYVAPDVREDLFFSGGWWWRPWGGRWYRSRSYDRGWVHHPGVPHFYHGVPPGWRDDYRSHHWGGGPWDYRPIPHDQLRHNWRQWRESGYWQRPEHRQHRYHRDGRPLEAHKRRDRRELRHDEQERRYEKKERRQDTQAHRRDR